MVHLDPDVDLFHPPIAMVPVVEVLAQLCILALATVKPVVLHFKVQ